MFGFQALWEQVEVDCVNKKVPVCHASSPFVLLTGTVLARLAVFPVIVKGQREAAKLNNVLPEMTKLTTRMNEAKQSGNKFECKCSFFIAPFSPFTLFILSCSWLIFILAAVAKAYTELSLFQKTHDVNPLRGFLIPLVQVGSSPSILLFCDQLKECNVSSGTRLHLLLHRTEKDGLLASSQHADRRSVLVYRPDSGRSFLHSSSGRHWHNVLHPRGEAAPAWHRLFPVTAMFLHSSPIYPFSL